MELSETYKYRLAKFKDSLHGFDELRVRLPAHLANFKEVERALEAASQAD